MRLLIVEDDEPLADSLASRVRESFDITVLAFARSLAEARAAIDGQTFDAVVVDLRLPSEVGAGDASVDYGLAVEAFVAKTQPGALRLFLTASEAHTVVEQLRMGEVSDFLADGVPFAVVDYVRKEGVDSLNECVDRLSTHHQRLRSIDGLSLEGADGLDDDTRRALAITVRIAGGTRGRILKQQGFSRCVTALVECLDDEGHSVGNAFCKSGPSVDIDREFAGFHRAEFRLPSTVRPNLARRLHVGIGETKALVFTKAPTATTFFDLVSRSPEGAAAVVERLPAALAPWRAGAATVVVDVGDALTAVVTDAVRSRFATELRLLAMDDLRGLELTLLAYCQHGDLHGANLFVTDSGEPFLIDFAYTDVQVGPVDPLSLELSLLFHPDSPLLNAATLSDCEHWLEGDHPATLDGFGPTVAACRQWLRTDGHDERSVAFGAMTYAVWILNHLEQPELALAIASSARRVLTR